MARVKLSCFVAIICDFGKSLGTQFSDVTLMESYRFTEINNHGDHEL